MTIIATPTSRRSIFRMKRPLGIVFVEAPFIIGLSSIEGRIGKTNAFFSTVHYMQTDTLLNGKTDRQKKPLIPCDSVVDVKPYSDDQQFV